MRTLRSCKSVINVYLLGLICGASILVAQYTTASLAGVVTDASGSTIVGANVTVENTETGLTKSQNTTADGAYSFPSLPVGSYRLIIEKSGFSRYVQQGITLTVNQAATQSVSLRVGALSQEITVREDASMVTTETATVGHLVNEKQVLDLPLNGRESQSLIFLAPGAVNTTNNYCGYNCQGGVYPSEQESAVNGGGPGNINYQMDGASHNDTYVNMNLPFPNPDAIREFNLQSGNMSAEYGNSQNVVNIVTKSGTNEFHGDLFEFLRNGDLNARNFFAPVHDSLKRNQFGGALGGPIKKDRLFFFGTYQGTRIAQAAAGMVEFVPTQAERNGDFSAIGAQIKDPVTGVLFPNNRVPQSRLSPAAQYFLQHIPLPNGPAGQLTFTGPRLLQHDDQFMPKIDYIAGRNQISGRYFYSKFTQPPDTGIATNNLLAMDSNGNQVRVQTVALSDTYSASPTLLFSTWFGWDSQVGGSLSGAPYSFSAAGVKIATPAIPQMDGLNVGGLFNFASSHYGAFNRGDYTIREVVTLERGRHELHLGGEVVRLSQDISNTNTQGGSFNFTQHLSGSNLVDFMLGQVSQFTQGAGQYQNLAGAQWSLFAQDNWKVNRTLVLQLGIRWDPYWPYTETRNRVPCFRPGSHSQRYPNAPVGLIYGGDPGCPSGSGYQSDLSNLGPRLGFAYTLDAKTVLRGGAGIYYTTPQSSQVNGTAATAPFAPRFNLIDVKFQDPWGSAGVPNPFPAQYGGGALPAADVKFTIPTSISNTFPLHWHVPSVGTWNIMLERQMGNNLLISAAYLGNAGYHLSSNQNGVRQVNPAVYIPGSSAESNTQRRRLYPNLGNVYLYASDYNSNYHALQLDIKKRFARGLSLWANYTWSHQRDNFPPTNDVGTDPFNRNFDWGNSLDNIPNIFHFSGVWELPKARLSGVADKLINGWELTGIVTWQSGFPFSVFSGVDNSFSGIGDDRADFTGTTLSQAKLDQSRSHARLIQQFFNTSVFGANAVGTFGNAGKNILEGPRLFNTDMGLIKNTKLSERATLQFRAEFFNAFNNVNFRTPDHTVTDDTFGKITSAGDPRILQFALKVSF